MEGRLKSYKLERHQASDYLELVTRVYQDAVTKCIADVSDVRDLMTIRSRVQEEGMSFATLTLPQFAKDLERALADGRIGPTHFASFAKIGTRRKRGAIPAFLQGMVGRLFNRETGELLDENPQSNGGAIGAFAPLVDAVRQICRLVAKVELECPERRTKAALDSFVKVEQSFAEFSLRDQDYRDFLRISDMLWGNMVGKLELTACNPRHGPGATFERVSGNAKFAWTSWHERLEPYFPWVGNAYPLAIAGDTDCKEFQNVTLVPRGAEPPVRVTCVPKDLRGPRVIAIESLGTQFVQQGIRDVLYEALERYPLTAGHINFRDQTINQRLALTSSIDGRLATIDLKDASDRVPAALALAMFRSNPALRRAIAACRTKSAQLPDGRVVPRLRKFASMGSALTFPIEAMYFYTIVVLALIKSQNFPLTFASIKQVGEDVYVYGDDILCPADQAISVIETLQKYNCIVNSAKSFWTGRFRESCGVDAFAGTDVTPVYVRQTRPLTRRSARQLISWTATAHLFARKGYVRTALFMQNMCERVLGPLPQLPGNSSGLSVTELDYRPLCERRKMRTRWNEDTHRLEVKAWVPSPVYRPDVLDGYAALSKSLTRIEENRTVSYGPAAKGGQVPLLTGQALIDFARKGIWRDVDDPALDQQHLERTALHNAVTLKHCWVPAH